MTFQQIPPDQLETDSSRVQAVRRYDLLKFPPSKSLDRITALAARIFNVPISVISIVDSDRIWFMSHHGIDIKEISHEAGISSVILHHAPYVINDAAIDLRTSSNPLVTGSFGLRFYVGVPLVSADGFLLGSLSIIDRCPRSFSASELSLLEHLGAIVMDELDLRLSVKKTLIQEAETLRKTIEEKDRVEYIANHDNLTGLANRRRFMHVLEETLLVAHQENIDKTLSIFMLDLDKFKLANDTFGHQVGDMILREVAARIKHCISDHDLAARLGGDEFIILKVNTDVSKSSDTAACLVELLSNPYNIEGQEIHLSSSIGLTTYQNNRDSSRQLIRQADLALYKAKSAGGRQYKMYDSHTNPMIQTRHRL